MSKIEVNTVDVQCGSTLTLGSSGKTVKIATGASTCGMGRTGTVDWCTTAKTSPFTSVSGKGYFVNTTSGGVTVTLPASPSAGDIIAIKDYANTFDTNSVTIGRNSSKINGETADALLSTESQSVTLIYVDSTKGWQDIHDSTSDITGTSFISASGGAATVTCGNFKTHIFTSDATFTVSSASNVPSYNKVEYLVVGGGAQGGNGQDLDGYGGGGGGAGGFRYYTTVSGSNSPLVAPDGVTVSATAYPITVGGGGTGPCGPGGSASTFSTITSAGGGAGAITNNPNPSEPPASRINGVDGGSGGGGSSKSGSDGTAGAGNTPPVSPPQGNAGGNGTRSGTTAGGGGGGAGASGSAGGSSDGGDGGVGSYIADGFIGPTAPSYGTPGPVSSTRYFSGGGGGASGYYPNNTGTGFGTGGSGGGSAGTTTGDATNATANTGGGGGGSSGASSTPTYANGGSGIVLIRYRYQ